MGLIQLNPTLKKAIVDDKNRRERSYLRDKFAVMSRRRRYQATVYDDCPSRRVTLRFIVPKLRVGFSFRKMFETWNSRYVGKVFWLGS